MRDRVELGVKLVCVILAVALVQQVIQMTRRAAPLRAAKVPEVPSWSPSVPKGDASPEGSPGGAPPGMMPGMPGMPGAGGPPSGSPSVAHVVQSGLLAPVMRPPPMALMGIVGQDVILRSPEGQVGMVRLGERLGSIELVRIGTNRVLVRENGQDKELTIFQGYGGESLLPKPAKGETK